MSYTITLLKKQPVANGGMSFYFEKPEAFRYIAGQYCDFTLIDPPETDREGNKRTFSLASAPCEPELMITTRLRDTAFKRVLANLPLGSTLTLDGPYGSLALPNNHTAPAVFLTGGIGATLVRSMLVQAQHDQSDQPLFFFYANHTPQDAVFLDEFQKMADTNQNLTFVPTMTDQQATDWPGEHGPITEELLRRYLSDLTAPIYYLSGPGDMVGNLRKMLLEAGVERSRIRSDQFVGY